MKKILTSLLILLSISVFAQSINNYREGRKAYEQGDLKTAIPLFEQAVAANDNYAEAWNYLGLAYVKVGEYLKAVNAFKKLESVDFNYFPWYHFEAANSYIQLNRFDEARASINKFKQKFPNTPKYTIYQHMARNREEYINQSPIIRAQIAEMSAPMVIPQVNSIYGDYTPQVNPTGTRLYFTSVRKGGFDQQKDTLNGMNWGEDIYFSSFENGAWNAPQLLPEPLNSMGDDFGSSFTGDGQLMVYVRCGDEEGIGNCDLYITQLVGTTWTEPQNMGNVVNSNMWDSQPTISSDGSRIIFASSRQGGYGGMDLYMTQKNHLGEWGVPQNLGSTVNTPFNENGPYLAPDGKTLYFASTGHPGYGGTDIFSSTFEDMRWSKPVNLGAPLNSEGDDTQFTISAAGKAYFASSRLDPNNYDIFEVELPDYLKPKPTIVVQGVITNAKTTDPVGAIVLIEDINSGELLAVNKSNVVSGEYLVVLPAGRNYSVSTNSEGFFFYSESFEVPKDTTYTEIIMDIALEPIEKGTKVVLNNIFFESGRAELKPISYVELNKAVDLLKDNPTMVIEIGGHTDNLGSDELNLKLSQSRADAVRDYMILAGLDEARIRSKGYGESMPIEDNATEEGRAANRRTEFEIVEF
ncbi:MAG: OmpA family protein [Bacteroidota bacterium]